MRRRVLSLYSPEALGWRGQVAIHLVYEDGSVETQQLENVITFAGKNLLRDGLYGNITGVTNTAVTWVALGNGATAEDASQTALISEQFRKAVTSQTASGTGALQTVLYVASTEANTFTINEIGWFAGSGASSSANTGVMIARVVPSPITKTSLQSLQITRTDTLS